MYKNFFLVCCEEASQMTCQGNASLVNAWVMGGAGVSYINCHSMIDAILEDVPGMLFSVKKIHEIVCSKFINI